MIVNPTAPCCVFPHRKLMLIVLLSTIYNFPLCAVCPRLKWNKYRNLQSSNILDIHYQLCFSALMQLIAWLIFSFSCPSHMIKMLDTLFVLDPLFRRTFLLVVPCQAFGRIAASGRFTALEMCTTLARILQDKSFISQEEVSFFPRFIKKPNGVWCSIKSWHLLETEVCGI